MKTPLRRACLAFCLLAAVAPLARAADAKPADGRFLYAAVPGIRDYLEYGGHGVLVFDIDRGHRFVRRIKSAGLDATGKPVRAGDQFAIGGVR